MSRQFLSSVTVALLAISGLHANTVNVNDLDATTIASTVVSFDDPCSSVTCKDVTCRSRQIEVVPPGECCAVCADCVVDGVPYKKRDTVTPKDPCYTDCKCIKKNQVRCNLLACEEVKTCIHNIPAAKSEGERCPRCPIPKLECVFEDRIYANGTRFKVENRNCQCKLGGVICTSDTFFY